MLGERNKKSSTCCSLFRIELYLFVHIFFPPPLRDAREREVNWKDEKHPSLFIHQNYARSQHKNIPSLFRSLSQHPSFSMIVMRERRINFPREIFHNHFSENVSVVDSRRIARILQKIEVEKMKN